MRRLWVGIVVLTVMLAMGIGLTWGFARIHRPMARNLRQAAEAAMAQDWENATALTEAARAEWEKYRFWIAAAADHEPLEQMEQFLAQLQIYGDLRETVDFAALCVRVAGLADAMLDSQQITWQNILSGGFPSRTAPVCQGLHESR